MFVAGMPLIMVQSVVHIVSEFYNIYVAIRRTDEKKQINNVRIASVLMVKLFRLMKLARMYCIVFKNKIKNKLVG